MNKILVIVSGLLMAVSAKAGILQWQVTQTEFNKQNISGGNLYAVDGGVIDGSVVGGAVSFTEIGSDMSFYVEYINSSMDVIAISDRFSYTDLVDLGVVTDDILGVSASKIWNPEPVAAPEPTSAMMMMLGIAFLGLKRRKA